MARAGDSDWATGEALRRPAAANQTPAVGGAPITGRVLTPPGAIVPPVAARPVVGACDPDLRAAGATRLRAPPDTGRLASIRTTGIAGTAAPAARVLALPSASGPALGAGGPENTWPSTPSWLKPPPRASATSAAIIADGTISATLEAANS